MSKRDVYEGDQRKEIDELVTILMGKKPELRYEFIKDNATVINNQDSIDTKKFKIREAELKVGDEIFNFKKEYISIKIDVEGHEIYTLNGLINNLSNNYCLLLIEIFNDNFNDVNSFLKKMNYKLIFKSQNRPDYIFSNINFKKD